MQEGEGKGEGQTLLQHAPFTPSPLHPGHFMVREESFPLRDLATLIGYPTPSASAERYAMMPKVLIHTADGVMAVLIDKAVESRSVMVKAMGRFLAKVHGVSGVTVMGDGTLVPLLNLPELLVAPLAMTAAATHLAAAAGKQ